VTTRDGTPTLLLYPSGIFFDPTNPDPAKIRVEDVAHGLAAIPRFGGHTAQPYSVAQHSVLVSRWIEEHAVPSTADAYSRSARRAEVARVYPLRRTPRRARVQPLPG